MSLESLVSKYIVSTEHVLKEMKTAETSIDIDRKEIEEVVGYAKAYLEDAKYYRDKGRFKVGLTSVVYCEGLLDALRLLGAVKFEWPVKRKGRRER